MSCIHQHETWSHSLTGLNRHRLAVGNVTSSGEKVGETEVAYTSFSPKNRSKMYQLACHFDIYRKLLDVIQKEALTLTQMKSESPAFGIRTASTIDLACKAILLLAPQEEKGDKKERKEGQKKPMKTSQETAIPPMTCNFPSGLSLQERTNCVMAIRGIIKNYFATNGDPIFSFGLSSQAIQDQIRQIEDGIITNTYTSLGMRRSASPIDFRQEDLAFFGLKKAPYNPKLMNCLAFALLQAKEREAAPVIFDLRTQLQIMERLTDYLVSLNYRPVDAPNEGDLVVYFDDHGRAKHVGYFTNGLVLSKLGTGEPHSHLHELFTVFPSYGANVVFFRKSATLFSEAELAAEMALIENEVRLEKKQAKGDTKSNS